MMRIRKTRWKLAYIAGGVVLLFSLELAASQLFAFSNPLYALAANTLTVLIYFGGVRIFRGAGEPDQPPRSWWRMTSQPRAGFIIGSLLALSSAGNVLDLLSGPPEGLFASMLKATVDAALAFLYVRSSIRLRRVPPHTVQELPRFRPLKP